MLADDSKICQLRKQGLSWFDIAEHFPGRTPGAIEVRYHTKPKSTNPSLRRASQYAGKEEWEVEKIFDTELNDGGLKLLVRWKTWRGDMGALRKRGGGGGA